jgi:DNA-binding FadR family transcriptional regulator
MSIQPSQKQSGNHGMFEPLKKKRFSDQIAELIRKRILEDRLAIGTSLPTELALAEEFQVSRTVIREALRILEHSGLVNIKKGPTGGIFVSDVYHRPITRSLDNLIISGDVTVDHLYDARLLIEPHIAIQAARYANKEDIQKLNALIEDSSFHIDDAAHLKRNNLKFHILLANASGNPVLAIMLKSVLELLIERAWDFLDLELERKFFLIHKEICEAIAQGLALKAGDLMQTDILKVMKTLKAFKKKDKE